MGLVSTLESTIRMTPGIFSSLQVHCDPFWGEGGGREGWEVEASIRCLIT